MWFQIKIHLYMLTLSICILEETEERISEEKPKTKLIFKLNMTENSMKSLFRSNKKTVAVE